MAEGKIVKDGKTLASATGTMPYVAESLSIEVRNMIIEEGHTKFEVVVKEGKNK